ELLDAVPSLYERSVWRHHDRIRGIESGKPLRITFAHRLLHRPIDSFDLRSAHRAPPLRWLRPPVAADGSPRVAPRLYVRCPAKSNPVVLKPGQPSRS